MEVKNELKEFDSLNNEWRVIAENTSDHAFETDINADDDGRDLFGFEGVYYRACAKGKEGEAYVVPNWRNEFI